MKRLSTEIEKRYRIVTGKTRLSIDVERVFLGTCHWCKHWGGEFIIRDQDTGAFIYSLCEKCYETLVH